MSADRAYDEDVDAPLRRPLRAAPGLGRCEETHNSVELVAENTALDRAIGKLAVENADLYRSNADQAKTVERLQTRLDKSEDRFRAWAKEMANREDARAARDEARDRREEALIGRINELERRLGERDPGGPDRRVGSEELARVENGRQERGRARPSNEFIGIGTAVGVAAGTVAADPTPVNFIIGAVGIMGAGIPWIRKLREAGNGDRARG